MDSSEATLTLFFTQGIGLKTWDEMGLIQRELEIYKRLSKFFKRINLVTYGGNRDKIYINKIDNLNILPTSWHSKKIITILHLLKKHYSEIKNSTIFKTNQIPGSEIPVWLKNRFGNKLITRCGYLHSRNIIKGGKSKKVIEKAIQLEKKAFNNANLGVVTSNWQRDIVIEQYKLNPDKIKVIPNYVVTETFKPNFNIQKNYDIVFIGRGGEEKNIENLLRAIKYLNSENSKISLALVGKCCFESKIKQIVDNYKLNVSNKGNVPNFELPNILNQGKIFILPSYYEGHPKTLLEAMSCAMPCIGTNVTGIKEDLEHLKTGFLCETDYMSIAKAIEKLLADESLRTRLGKNARDYIVKNYSIDKVLKMELETIQEVLNQ